MVAVSALGRAGSRLPRCFPGFHLAVAQWRQPIGVAERIMNVGHTGVKALLFGQSIVSGFDTHEASGSGWSHRATKPADD